METSKEKNLKYKSQQKGQFMDQEEKTKTKTKTILIQFQEFHCKKKHLYKNELFFFLLLSYITFVCYLNYLDEMLSCSIFSLSFFFKLNILIHLLPSIKHYRNILEGKKSKC